MASPNNAPTGGVTLVGSAIQGETLEAFNNLADLDGIGTIRYQWQVDGVSLTLNQAVEFVRRIDAIGIQTIEIHHDDPEEIR